MISKIIAKIISKIFTKEPIDFSLLLNKTKNRILSHLTLQDLLMLKLTNKAIKEIIICNMRLHRKSTLTLPPNIKYTQNNILFLRTKIQKLCRSIGKEPKECQMTLNCDIFYDTNNTRVNTRPPPGALTQIEMSEVRILLKIFFKILDVSTFGELWPSYMYNMSEILERLHSIESLELDFSYQDIDQFWLDGGWFNIISRAIQNLQNLSSLRILGNAPWNNIINCLPSLTQITSLEIIGTLALNGIELVERLTHMTQLTSLSISGTILLGDQLTDCLSLMPQLTSFRISDVNIENLNFQQFGQSLQTSLPFLSDLRLSNTWIQGVEIYEILPYIRGILVKLTSLDLSNNQLDGNKFRHNIIPSLVGYIPYLTSLNISHNYIGNDIYELIPLFQSLNNLVELIINDTSIDDISMTVLITYLHQMPFLRSLNVSNNHLTQPIIDLIQNIHSITLLDVSEQLDD